MKLKQIKLAGFKSFVDPTTLDLRSDLVAVVGPNGCGKSNVIDAVRWVMGESSAKTLRGESITDVIFNGSNTRKPIGQASIELFFDNSDGSIGGEYAAYAEISVRREVTRDAISNYYLNGTKCRRRDIVDVFLGTGLGSRSYSIIEQGMISRVIESKPEDLRCFVEEAAGISVYKKRRHDTELRMRHTIENLARLEDLREEQIKLLEKLQRQAESAQKYQVLSNEKTNFESQLLAMRWQNYDTALSQYGEQIGALSVNLEEKQATRTNIGTQLEQLRILHTDKQDVHEEVQTKFYDLGAKIARAEQGLQYHKERHQELNANIEQTLEAIEAITEQKNTDSQELFECESKLSSIQPAHEEVSARALQAEELHLDARADLDTANLAWEEYQQQAQKPQQEAEVQKARIEHLDKQVRELQNRIDRLSQEKKSLDIVAMQKLVDDLAKEQDVNDAKNVVYKEEIRTIQDAIYQQRNLLLEKQDIQNKLRSQLQQLSGRRSSLQVLQQAAMGKDDKDINNWLAQNGLENKQRLAEVLNVEPGYELAVETVLADYLEAICLEDSISTVISTIKDLSQGSIVLLEKSGSSETIQNIRAESLACKVKSSAPIDAILSKILVVESLEKALQLKGTLDDGMSIVTADGIWLGKNWVRVSRDKDSKRGVIAREQELQEIQETIIDLQEQSKHIEEDIHQCTSSLNDLEISLVAKQQDEMVLVSYLREVSSKFSAANQKLEHMRSRLQRIDIEINEHQQNLNINGEEATASRNSLENAIELMAKFSAQKEQIVAQREECLAKERNTKHLAKEAQDELHELEIQLQTISTKYKGLQHTISRVDQQLSDLHKRHQQYLKSLQDDVDPEKQLFEELEDLLSQRQLVEADLQEARIELDSYAMQMQTFESQRSDLEKVIADLKESLENCKLERQSLLVRKETIDEQLHDGSIELKNVLENMPENANEEEWTSQIESISKKIANLGAVNLAASAELETETQKQEYLEAQYTDLKEALTTLDNAIKKIDRETKAKFQETFNQINGNFNVLFPKLFGGGKAYLEIVGEDLLNAGVAVMAMPPGKKNSSIHLLSGGEKALTAVALVFSIFQINPAPFCMLDEVDAPLDESNVVRFSNLIKEMSSQVQFIIITHNKTTMEIANQLIGVTMKEPGVSRLVTVDINEAVEMSTV